MKRITLLSVAILGTLSWLSVSLASASVAARAEYAIAQIKALAAYTNATIVGMDPQGDLVATVYRGNHSLAVVVINAGSKDERLVKLGIPSGFTNVSAVGIDATGAIAVNAWRMTNYDVGYVASPTQSGYTWVRLAGLGSRADSFAVSGIAANGDVAGTRSPNSPTNSRAVEWVLEAAGTYAKPVLLPLSKGSTESAASSIWSGGGRVLIGGGQSSSNRINDRFTIWSPAPAQSGRLTGMVARMWFLRPPVTIGGRGNHVYLAGQLMGIDTGGGWMAAVRFSASHPAKPGTFQDLALPPYKGAECFYGANGVTADANGRFFGVGDLSCIGSKLPPEALLWRGSGVVKLQGLIHAGSGWRLSDAQVISPTGRIAGPGTFHGMAAIYVLTPATTQG